MAHIKYLTEDIIVALDSSRSVKQASFILGMNRSSMIERCLNDKYLRIAYDRCLTRGLSNMGMRMDYQAKARLINK